MSTLGCASVHKETSQEKDRKTYEGGLEATVVVELGTWMMDGLDLATDLGWEE